MRILNCPLAKHALRHIERAVQRSECLVAKKDPKKSKDWQSFPTTAPRDSTYGASSARLFLTAVQGLKLSRSARFADLGSGIGNICLAAGLYFDNVTGFELDPRLITQARIIAADLHLPNIAFEEKDFLEENLSAFDLLYFYHPFQKGLVPLMRWKLAQTRPGTLVISSTGDVVRERIFDHASFKKVFSLEGILPVRSHSDKFTTYRRVR